MIVLPDSEELRKFLRYDEVSGLLYWQNRTGNQKFRNGALAGRESRGYRQVRFFGRSYYEHRIIFKMLHGYDPVEVDHKRKDCGTGNTPSNIRNASSSQNKSNRRGFAASGFKGVYPNSGKYMALITFNGVQTYLGMYDTPEEAHENYSIMAYILFGEYANTTHIRS